MHEPVLVLDKHLSVVIANESFYRAFQVELVDTEKKTVYELGNGQWEIPALRRLLENILPQNSFFKGFEVTHDFPFIGRRIMLLNARQIKAKQKETFPSIILLAIEDVTDIMVVGETLASHAQNVEMTLKGRTDKLDAHIQKLEEELGKLREKD